MKTLEESDFYTATFVAQLAEWSERQAPFLVPSDGYIETHLREVAERERAGASCAQPVPVSPPYRIRDLCRVMRETVDQLELRVYGRRYP